MLDLSVSSVMASLIFSGIGMWMFRQGKLKSDLRIIVIAVLLMGYTYLTSGPWFDWGIGLALCFGAYQIWN